MRRQRGRIGLMVAALGAMLSSSAVADVLTEQSASILVFPKVIADGTRDTLIQITNTSNSMVHAHCYYVNGALTFPDLPEGPNNPPQCLEIDFDIWLTKQQPTYWLVSEGRVVNPQDLPCARGSYDCDNAGIDPGRVPPVVGDFTGELKCVEVDASGAPLGGNHLKGEATLITKDVNNPFNAGECVLSGDPSSCDSKLFDLAKYNALGILGNENNNGDGILCLGGEVSGACPNGAEYNACPHTWMLNHLAEGAANPAVSGSSVVTDVTIVPCTENFETQEPTTVTVQFAIVNEYEQIFSASTSITCWDERKLTDVNPVFDVEFVGTDFLQTHMRPSSGTPGGFLVVADEWHNQASGNTSTAAVNVHNRGEVAGDVITIADHPATEQQP